MEWEDPPERTAVDWDKVAKRLRRSPMKWAKVMKQGRISTINAVRQSNIKAVRKDKGFECRTANNNTKEKVADLYLRYNPDNDRST